MECVHKMGKRVGRLAADKADHRHRRLLSVRRERPCNGNTATKPDELASLHAASNLRAS
jgi:hypothetical protein